MSVLRKICLTLAAIFLSLTLAVLILKFSGYCILAFGVTSDILITVFFILTIAFTALSAVARRSVKPTSVATAVLLSLAAVMIMITGFYPRYKYNTHISVDGLHKIVVEEKSALANSFIAVYEKVSFPFAKSVYSTAVSADKSGAQASERIDYSVVFEEDGIRLNIPRVQKEDIQIKYSKR